MNNSRRLLQDILGRQQNSSSMNESSMPEALRGLDLSGTMYDNSNYVKDSPIAPEFKPSTDLQFDKAGNVISSNLQQFLKEPYKNNVMLNESQQNPQPQSVSKSNKPVNGGPNGTPDPLSDEDRARLNDIISGKADKPVPLTPEEEYQQSLDEKRKVLMMAGLGEAAAGIGSSIAGLGGNVVLKPDNEFTSMKDIAKGMGEGALQKMKDRERKEAIVASLAEKVQARKDKQENEKYRREESRANRDLKEVIGMGMLGQNIRSKDKAVIDDIKSIAQKYKENPVIKDLDKTSSSYAQLDAVMDELAKGNELAIPAFGIKLGKGYGETGAMSQGDVTRYMEGKSLSRDVSAWIANKFEGRVPKMSQDEAKALIQGMKDKADEIRTKIRNGYVQQATHTAKELNYDESKVPGYFYNEIGESPANLEKKSDEDTKNVNGVLYKRGVNEKGQSGWIKVK